MLTEAVILSDLGFSLTTVSSLDFLGRFTAVPDGTREDEEKRAQMTRELGTKLLALSLPLLTMRKWRLSTQAAAAVYLVRRRQGIKPIWPRALARRTGHSRGQIDACAAAMSDLEPGRLPLPSPHTVHQGVAIGNNGPRLIDIGHPNGIRLIQLQLPLRAPIHEPPPKLPGKLRFKAVSLGRAYLPT